MIRGVGETRAPPSGPDGPRLPFLAGTLVFLAAYGCQPAPEALSFAELSAVQVPEGFGVSGGTLSPTGDVVIWSSRSGRVAVWKPAESFRELDVDGGLIQPVAADFASEAGSIVVIDAKLRSLVHVLESGALSRRTEFPEPLLLQGGIRTGDQRWIVTGLGAGGDAHVLEWNLATGHLSQVLVLDQGQLADPGPVDTRVAGDEHGVVVTLFRPPGTVFALDPVTGLPNRFSASDPAAPEELREMLADTTQLWRSVSTVRLEGFGYVQTVSDLRSDRRLLISFDPGGRVRRFRQLEAPFGIIGARGRHVLAVRKVARDVSEVVILGWERAVD